MALVRFIKSVSLWGGRVGALIVLPLILAMVYEVFSRYGFSTPTVWAFELSYMMMGTIFMLGIAYALSVGAHVNVDFVHNSLPKRFIAIIDLVGYLVLTGLAGWLTYNLALYTVSGYRSGEGSGLSAWNPQVWPYRTVFCVGFALFTLQTFAKALESGLTALGFGEDRS